MHAGDLTILEARINEFLMSKKHTIEFAYDKYLKFKNWTLNDEEYGITHYCMVIYYEE